MVYSYVRFTLIGLAPAVAFELTKHISDEEGRNTILESIMFNGCPKKLPNIAQHDILDAVAKVVAGA